MKLPAELRENWRWVEWVLAFAVLVGLIVIFIQSYDLGYFPQPFFFDTDDTFRDWFSTAIWAHEEGAYDSWLTVYPPLSFAFLKFAGIASCYETTHDKIARACDWVGIGLIHLIYIANIFIAARLYMKIDRRTALPRSFALTAGMPMVFGLERGNLILLCFTCIMLGWGPLVRSARLRWVFVALAVNFKIYLIAGVLIHLTRRRWLWVEGCLVAIVLVYLVSYAIYGAGTPVEIVENLINFSSGARPQTVLDIWYPNTFQPLYYVLTQADVPITSIVGSDLVDFGSIIIPTVVHSTQLLILVAAAATWLRPEVVPPFRLTFLAFALAMITSEASAYTQPIMFLFVFMERWQGWTRPLAIALSYIMCIPGDILIGSPGPVLQFSYIADHYVISQYGLSVGMFLRPLVLLMMSALLSIHTIRTVWSDVREQGWKDRWRFRHDLPLLPGAIAPSRPEKGNS